MEALCGRHAACRDGSSRWIVQVAHQNGSSKWLVEMAKWLPGRAASLVWKLMGLENRAQRFDCDRWWLIANCEFKESLSDGVWHVHQNRWSEWWTMPMLVSNPVDRLGAKSDDAKAAVCTVTLKVSTWKLCFVYLRLLGLNRVGSPPKLLVVLTNCLGRRFIEWQIVGPLSFWDCKLSDRRLKSASSGQLLTDTNC